MQVFLHVNKVRHVCAIGEKTVTTLFFFPGNSIDVSAAWVDVTSLQNV